MKFICHVIVLELTFLLTCQYIFAASCSELNNPTQKTTIQESSGTRAILRGATKIDQISPEQFRDHGWLVQDPDVKALRKAWGSGALPPALDSQLKKRLGQALDKIAALEKTGFRAPSDLPLPAPSKKRARVFIIGSGPSGIYAAKYLSEKGVQVYIFEKDHIWGGLIRTGYRPDKGARKDLMDAMRKVIDDPNIIFIGNSSINGAADLDFLGSLKPNAILFTNGPGEIQIPNIPGREFIIPANDVYNYATGYSDKLPPLGDSPVFIGSGQVAGDTVLHSLLSLPIKRATVVVRGSAAEINDKLYEFGYYRMHLNDEEFTAELLKQTDVLKAMGIDVHHWIDELLNGYSKNSDSPMYTGKPFSLRFLLELEKVEKDPNGTLHLTFHKMGLRKNAAGQIERYPLPEKETINATGVVSATGYVNKGQVAATPTDLKSRLFAYTGAEKNIPVYAFGWGAFEMGTQSDTKKLIHPGLVEFVGTLPPGIGVSEDVRGVIGPVGSRNPNIVVYYTDHMPARTEYHGFSSSPPGDPGDRDWFNTTKFRDWNIDQTTKKRLK